jgi:hypothetical protein
MRFHIEAQSIFTLFIGIGAPLFCVFTDDDRPFRFVGDREKSIGSGGKLVSIQLNIPSKVNVVFVFAPVRHTSL